MGIRLDFKTGVLAKKIERHGGQSHDFCLEMGISNIFFDFRGKGDILRCSTPKTLIYVKKWPRDRHIAVFERAFHRLTC
jgi:hypothetical protein